MVISQIRESIGIMIRYPNHTRLYRKSVHFSENGNFSKSDWFTLREQESFGLLTIFSERGVENILFELIGGICVSNE